MRNIIHGNRRTTAEGETQLPVRLLGLDFAAGHAITLWNSILLIVFVGSQRFILQNIAT